MPRQDVTILGTFAFEEAVILCPPVLVAVVEERRRLSGCVLPDKQQRWVTGPSWLAFVSIFGCQDWDDFLLITKQIVVWWGIPSGM